MAGLNDNDIDGLLDRLDSAATQEASEQDAGQAKEKKKEKKKKKEKRSDDIEMGAMNYNSNPAYHSSDGYNAGGGPAPQSTYSSGAYTSESGAPLPPLPRREFSMCSPGNQDLVINMCLLLGFCAFEAVFSMMSNSLVLMIDFYRRLAGIFTMVYSLEVLQCDCDSEVIDGMKVSQASIPEINACTTTAARHEKAKAARRAWTEGERRRYYLAALMVACYLLTVAFMSSMNAIVAMYGVNLKTVSRAGWIMMIGALCLVLDCVHLRYGVQVYFVVQGEDVVPVWQRILVGTYGSLTVCFSAFIAMTIGGSYMDPILTIVFASAIAYGSTNTLMQMASALQYKAWEERA